ncbi:MAG: class I SAM-dependent methyltransferase [Polyangiales bacterium]
MKHAFSFDQRYYKRFYGDRRTRVTDQKDEVRRARFIGQYLAYLEQPVHNIVDLGCGMGQLRKPLLSQFPDATYVGVEHSAYACERYGWKHASVVDFRARGRFDLVVCKGVLQYLDAREAALALANFARLCRGALYLEALTREDWVSAADQKRTDGEVYLRPASFYRRHLREHFTAVGGGIFVHRRSPAVLYALEAL